MEWFFSYGLSTDPDQMRQDAGGWKQFQAAQLHDHAYMFTGHHPEFKAGTSTVVPMPGATVLGAAYEIDEAQLDTILANGHQYKLRKRPLELDQGTVTAYVLEPGVVEAPRPPAKSYVERVRKGLSCHYDREIVDRYLAHAEKCSGGSNDPQRQMNEPAAYKHEYDVLLRRLFPWDATQEKPFGGAIAALNPGESTAAHCHDEEESFIFLSGEGHMRVDESSFKVGKGDVVYLEPFSAHTVENIGTDVLEVLCVWWNEVVPAERETEDELAEAVN